MAASNPLIRQAIIAGLTKYPRLELLGRYAGAVAGGATLGYAACYVVTKGYYVPSKDLVSLVAQTFVGVAVTAIAAKLGLNAQQTSDLTVVANTIEAAATGQVPEAIAARATPEQAARIEQSPAQVVPVAPLPAAK